ncbi:peptidyl-tRNA hydrolase II domain-containing protein [Blyttiomyces helicus]|uniref:peptidyl-tRNA hydrolase n=1 Tax=Blyttiomyces helicus TaxID=388810 RepID=A0A4P9VXA1_9FUNG|nr:peptidyl-tRNA hydrolase II domain-containing protein [Blyttiomyces helicus]|eukprot:RKO82910.1 peptidyl-tRNA hydrolase II domain-containing protein [Blyttiomyces helicus]
MDSTTTPPPEPLTMFIVVRKDLSKTLGWPAGSVMTQAAHAATAVMWENREDEAIKKYMGELATMHKVTYEVKNENALKTIAESLSGSGLVHHVWIEQPENIQTCLATLPYKKSQVSEHFKKCSLYR